MLTCNIVIIINFPFGTMENLLFLGVPILKHIMVLCMNLKLNQDKYQKVPSKNTVNIREYKTRPVRIQDSLPESALTVI